MKKLKFLVGAVALFAVVAVNVWNAATTMQTNELDVEDVEFISEAEPNLGPAGVVISGLIIYGGYKVIDHLVDGYGRWIYCTKRNDMGELIESTAKCVSCSIFNDEGCIPPEEHTAQL